jgi:hypothetical protein
VEISTNQDNFMFIAAFDMNSPESLLIELQPSKAQEIMK